MIEEKREKKAQKARDRSAMRAAKVMAKPEPKMPELPTFEKKNRDQYKKLKRVEKIAYLKAEKQHEKDLKKYDQDVKKYYKEIENNKIKL